MRRGCSDSNAAIGGLLLIFAFLLALTNPAWATQHLIRPGEHWHQLDQKLGPGDEIILMPGTHRPATLENAQGTAERPIIIRSLDPKNPSTIDAARYGIRLIDPRHVRIADVIITGATINGIALEGANPTDAETSADRGHDADKEDDNALPGGDIQLKAVSVINTGPRGLRHAMNIQRLCGVTIEGCRIEGWAGSAIEMVACRDILIQGGRFKGTEDHGQVSGVRIRAGSVQARISECRFENTGDQGVCIGGGSRLDEFTKAPKADAEPGTLFEACKVEVEQCEFRDSLSAVAFVNCLDSAMRSCTVYRTRRAIISIRREQEDPRFTTATGCALGGNLIVWQPGDISRIAHLGKGANAEGFNLEDNLWWSSDYAETIEDLGGLPGKMVFPQVTGVDPKLDAELKPQAAEAGPYGIPTP